MIKTSLLLHLLLLGNQILLRTEYCEGPVLTCSTNSGFPWLFFTFLWITEEELIQLIIQCDLPHGWLRPVHILLLVSELFWHYFCQPWFLDISIFFFSNLWPFSFLLSSDFSSTCNVFFLHRSRVINQEFMIKWSFMILS